MVDIGAVVEVFGRDGVFRVIGEDGNRLVLRGRDDFTVDSCEVRTPGLRNILSSKLPWESLLHADDMSCYLSILQSYPHLPSGSNQFYSVILPTLDYYNGSKSLLPVEAMQEYYRAVTNCIKIWLGTYPAGTDPTQETVIFHLIKKIFAAASLQGYGDGYRLGLLLNRNCRNAPSFAVSIATELVEPISQLIQRESTPIDTCFALFDQLIPSLSPHFHGLMEQCVLLTLKFAQSVPNFAHHSVSLNVLIQLYHNMSRSSVQNAIYSLILQVFKDFLQSNDPNLHRKACVFLVPMITTACKQSLEQAEAFPLAEIAASADSLTTEFRAYFLETILSEKVYEVLSQIASFRTFLRKLCSISVISCLFRLYKWTETKRLVKFGLKISHLQAADADIVSAVTTALNASIPVESLPIIDLFPVSPAVFLSYFHSFHRKEQVEILIIACFHAKTWLKSIEFLKVSNQPLLLAVFVHRISVFGLLFTRDRSLSGIHRLPRSLSIHITDYL